MAYTLPNQFQSLQRSIAEDLPGYTALGNTEKGREFVMKALNPSYKPYIDGIPDGCGVQTLGFNYKNSHVLNLPPAADGATTYNVTIVLHDDPIAVADVIIEDARYPGSLHLSYTYLNPLIPDLVISDDPLVADQEYNDIKDALPAANDLAHAWPRKVMLTTAGYKKKLRILREDAQKARRLYVGCTVQMNANSQNDQGLVKAGQIEQSPAIESAVDPVSGRWVNRYVYGGEDFLTLDSVTNYSRHYSGLAVGGAYIPLRRPGREDELCRWINLQTPICISSDESTARYPTGINPQQGWSASPKKYIAIQNHTIMVEPFGSHCGFAFFTGLSSTASLDINIYHGIEICPMDTSRLKPLWKESPAQDQLALQNFINLRKAVQDDAYASAVNRFEWLGKALSAIAPYAKRFAEGAVENMDQGLTGMITGGLGNAFVRPGSKRKRINLVE